MGFSGTLITSKINFYTDASGSPKLGFGGVFEGHWMFSQWEKSFVETYKPSIEFLELYAVSVGIELWSEYLQNRRDNILRQSVSARWVC